MLIAIMQSLCYVINDQEIMKIFYFSFESIDTLTTIVVLDMRICKGERFVPYVQWRAESGWHSRPSLNSDGHIIWCDEQKRVADSILKPPSDRRPGPPPCFPLCTLLPAVLTLDNSLYLINVVRLIIINDKYSWYTMSLMKCSWFC